MPQKRAKLKSPAEKFLRQAKALDKPEAERLMSRMRGKFSRRLEDRQLSRIEVLAHQLEFEEEELKEWRRNMTKIRDKGKR